MKTIHECHHLPVIHAGDAVDELTAASLALRTALEGLKSDPMPRYNDNVHDRLIDHAVMVEELMKNVRLTRDVMDKILQEEKGSRETIIPKK